MPTFKFRHRDATITTVKAPDEATARTAAMIAKWGKPRPLSRPIPESSPARHLVIGDPTYHGSGLDLTSVTE